jgi:Skp family chaperone for outer membrane proteins
MYLSVLVGVGGVIYLAGSSQAQPPAGAPGAPATQQPQARPTVAVFNMAAVMGNYGKAKYQIYQLNQKRLAQSGDLVKWRAEYIQLQTEGTKTLDPKMKEDIGRRMVDLARRIEDKDREVSKMLNDDASAIISQLYDEIKTVVDKTAEMNGYHIVFAYPDNPTPDDRNASAMIKEIKLKPTAAYPFFVSRHVDLTGVIVETLNKWYPAPAVPDTPPQPQGGQPQPGQPIPGQPIPGQPNPGQPNPGVPGRPGGQ